MEIIKTIHVTFGILTIISFTLRSIFMWIRHGALQKRLVKVFPHIIDSILLLSGILLVIDRYVNFYQHPWLLAKMAAVILYIIVGSIALKYGRTVFIRSLSVFASWGILTIIVTLAMTRSITLGY